MDALNKNFSFDGEKNSVDFLYDDKDVMIVSIDLFHVDQDGECNKNQCNISREAAEKSLDTIKNKPIIFRYNSICKDFVSDVTDHAHDDKEAFEMKIAGHIPADSRITFIERENGKTYCNAEAVIHKKYVPQLVNIIQANDGALKVSIEILAKGEDNEDGVFVIEQFSMQGVCLLGRNVEEGIEGSHMEVLKFSKKEIDTMNRKYLKFSKAQESNQTIFDKIKTKIGEEDMEKKEFSMGLNELNNKIWQILDQYKYRVENYDYDYNKYFIEEIYPDEKYIIVRDNEKVGYFKMNYSIDDNGVYIDVEGRLEVEKDWHERPLNEKRFSIVFAKEEYGTGEAIKVDKSKEAVSDKAWGEVDKTELRHKVLKAKNYKTLVKDVYAEVEEGWEDAPSEKLKYPIMLIEGDTAVYARYGLASALGYAKAENNTSVVDKVEKLYETIKIKEKEEKMDGEKELQNKLDKDNSELEHIRDDADAIEDDEKEELRKKEEVSNAVVDAPEEDKLKDDIDSDKDYWKKKFEELEPLYNSCLEELKVYKDKEDKAKMLDYLNSFRTCFSDDDFKVMASKIDVSEKVEFEKEIDEKVKDFVRNMSKAAEEEKKAKEELEMKNSSGTFINPNKNKNFGNQMRTIDDVLDSYK